MKETERAIVGLEECYRLLDCIGTQEECKKLVLNAIDALKEQEVAKPITEHHLFLCPVCKNTLYREQKFCHECGKRIEWEGR